MRKNIFYAAGMAMSLLLSLSACSDEEKYSTSVVRDINLYLNENPWSVNTGLSTKPLFIYKDNGEYVANYSSLYRFQLLNGNYKIVSTTESDSIPAGTNLNDIVIHQSTNARGMFSASAPVEYCVPSDIPLSAYMYSRTSVLRLKATDKKSDRSYSTVRAVVHTPISGYKLSDASYVMESMDVIRDKATATGGVNYIEDFVLFETNSNKENVNVRIDYLDDNLTVIQSKMIDGSFSLLANDTTQIAFALNNADEPIIQDYTVTIASENWLEEDITPETPIKIPAGYTYVNPEEDINTIYNKLKADDTQTDIKLFLKAGASYSFNSGVLNDAPKGIYIRGEISKNGEQLATLAIGGNISLGADTGTPMKISGVVFENIDLKPSGDLFRFKNQDFEVEEITFRNCELRDLPATLWYQIADGDYMQVIHSFTIDNCRFININLGKSGLLGLGNKQILPIYNITFKNSTFHAKTLGTASLITNLNKIDKDLTVTIENCTCVNLGGGDMTFFNMAATNASTFTLIVKNNLWSGNSEEGKGSWMKLGNVTTSDISSNYRTKGFSLNDWNVEENNIPVELPSEMNDLFENVVEGNLTIKDKNSIVVTQGIGDPHWIK